MSYILKFDFTYFDLKYVFREDKLIFYFSFFFLYMTKMFTSFYLFPTEWGLFVFLKI